MMFKSRTDKILEELQSKGRLKRVKVEYTIEHLEEMKNIKDESRRKQAASAMSAKNIKLD